MIIIILIYTQEYIKHEDCCFNTDVNIERGHLVTSTFWIKHVRNKRAQRKQMPRNSY